MTTPDAQVAILFARKDSIYKTMPECDVYDKVTQTATAVKDRYE